MNSETNSYKFASILAIIASSLAAGAFLLAWPASNHFFQFAPKYDGYVQPRDLGTLIDNVQKSVLTVSCEVTKKDSWLGTAWVVDPQISQEEIQGSALVTNYHVIEECLSGKGTVKVKPFEGKFEKVQILKTDKRNDLALLELNENLEILGLSEYGPWPGYWVVSLGSAAGFEGSVAIGNVLNVLSDEVLITNNISEGNSGGPLVDNEGNVVGIVSWGMDYKKEQYSGAKGLDTLCFRIIKCTYSYDSEPTWFNYED